MTTIADIEAAKQAVVDAEQAYRDYMDAYVTARVEQEHANDTALQAIDDQYKSQTDVLLADMEAKRGLLTTMVGL